VELLQKIALSISIDSQFGVVSAFVEGREDNVQRHQDLIVTLRDAGFNPKEFRGEWEGVKELSVFVPHIPEADLIEFGRKYEQDAVFFRDSNGPRIINL
jgi:hypothetical protein